MYAQTIARIVADQLGIRVVYSDTANTFYIAKDRGTGAVTIVMSRIALAASEGEEEAVEMLTRGAIAHEALGHGYHSDMGYAGTAKTAFGNSLANVLEDVRIERLAPLQYPGAARALREMILMLEERQGFFVGEENCIFEEALLKGLARKLRTDVLKQPLPEGETARLIGLATTEMGQDLFNKVEALAIAASYAPGTGDVVRISDEIVALLKSSKKAPPPPPPAETPDQKQDGQPGDQGDDQKQDGQTGGQGDDQKQDGKPGDSQPTKPANETGGDLTKASAGSTDGQHDEPLDFSDRIAIDLDYHKVLEETLAAALDPGSSTTVEMTDIREGIEHFEAFTPDDSTRRIIQRLRSGMQEALRALTEDEDDDEDSRGRLDTNRLTKAFLGIDPRPFLSDGKPGRGLSTEVVLMFDKSGSMRVLGTPFLRNLLFASGSVLASFAPDVRFNLAFFSGTSTLAHTADKHWTPEHGSKVAQSYDPVGITCWASSAFPLIPILAKSNKVRKVFVTVCDGDIDADANPHVMAEMKRYRIETSFVSIGKAMPAGLKGETCEEDGAAFAKAFSKAILAAISPQFA